MRELRSMRKGGKIVHSPMFMTEGGSDRSNSARNGRSYAALPPAMAGLCAVLWYAIS